INPPTVSGGPDTASNHGLALAETVTASMAESLPIEALPFAFSSQTIKLPTRSSDGSPARSTIQARLAALRLGSLALIFLPGEIFVETAQRIEAASPFRQTLIIGFAENSIGYVPTRRAFREGGYEIGPGKWSY